MALRVAVYFECMLCGKKHRDGSKILLDHAHKYYQSGGTFPFSQWKIERRLLGEDQDGLDMRCKVKNYVGARCRLQKGHVTKDNPGKHDFRKRYHKHNAGCNWGKAHANK